MSLLSPVRPAVDVCRAGPGGWAAGVRVVLAAQQATGLPATSPEALAARTRRRQRWAHGVWLAEVVDPGQGHPRRRAVGHALCLPPTPEEVATWAGVDDPAVAAALVQGRLVLLGGLAVDPAWAGRGVAGRLVEARLAHVARRGRLAAAAVWDASPGSLALARRHGRSVGRDPERPLELFVYDR